LSEEVGYLEHWTKSAAPNVLNNPVALTVTDNPDKTVTISANTDKGVNAVMDVALSYDILTVDNPSSAILHKVLWVNDATLGELHPGTHYNYSLPERLENWFIPITIIDGYGKIILSAAPARDTTIKIRAIGVVKLIADPYPYISIRSEPHTQVLKLTDNNWTSGVYNFGNVLLFSNINAPALIEKQPKALVINGTAYSVVSCEADNNGYIRITMQDREIALKFAYPAQFKIQY
jgi:hypothetical protein